MAADSEFCSRLISIGLSEKEAQAYLHLLKYGPKPPSLLAKSLKTYREDVYRTITGLIDKGMVNPSLESPTVYVATELDIALDAALKRHESELREMEVKKQELMELSRQQRFSQSDEFSSYKIVRGMREAMAVAAANTDLTERQVVTVMPEIIFAFDSSFGLNEVIKRFIDRGGNFRMMSTFSYPSIALVQEGLDVGMDIRHLDGYSGIMFAVFDRKIAASVINFSTTRPSLNEPFSGIVAYDSVYADYLIATFEMLWAKAIPATQRIEELLKEGPPKA